MPDLIAKSALSGQSVTLGSVTLAELEVGPITSVAVLPNGAAAVAKGLKPLGLTFPAPNTLSEKKGARLIWTGRDQAFLTGVAVPVLDGAALTDQSDGWTVLGLDGAEAGEVLARLVPIDLRLAIFAVGAVCRTQLNHMNVVLLRSGATAFEIMVFRSMARTAWHELHDAMQMLAARVALRG